MFWTPASHCVDFIWYSWTKDGVILDMRLWRSTSEPWIELLDVSKHLGTSMMFTERGHPCYQLHVTVSLPSDSHPNVFKMIQPSTMSTIMANMRNSGQYGSTLTSLFAVGHSPHRTNVLHVGLQQRLRRRISSRSRQGQNFNNVSTLFHLETSPIWSMAQTSWSKLWCTWSITALPLIIFYSILY